MTASNAAVINRLVHLARTGSCAVAGVNGTERPEFADMPHAEHFTVTLRDFGYINLD